MLRAAGSYPTERLRETAVVTIDLPDLTDPRILAIVTVWQRNKGWRTMPQDVDVLLRDLDRHSVHISLADVVDEGHDYRFRLIGREHVRAYGTNHVGKSVSDIVALSPRFGKQLRASYNLVRMTGRPFALRGSVGSESPDANFVSFETAYLPVGRSGEVNHIVNAAIYSSRRAFDA